MENMRGRRIETSGSLPASDNDLLNRTPEPDGVSVMSLEERDKKVEFLDISGSLQVVPFIWLEGAKEERQPPF